MFFTQPDRELLEKCSEVMHLLLNKSNLLIDDSYKKNNHLNNNMEKLNDELSKLKSYVKNLDETVMNLSIKINLIESSLEIKPKKDTKKTKKSEL
jgi:hypothetical protein